MKKILFMKISGYLAAACFTLIFSFFFSGCFNHQLQTKPVIPSSSYPDAIEQAKKEQRYFLLKSGINLYTITSVDLDKAKQEMTVTLNEVDSSHLIGLKNFNSRGYKPKKGDSKPSPSIHLYMTDSTSYTLDEPHTIRLEKVGKVELVD